MVAHQHVDTPLPRDVILAGIGFRVAEHEGLIVFSETSPIWGMGCRFSFHRNSAGCWEVSIDAHCASERPSMNPDRIAQAYEIVQRCRGDSFGRPYPRAMGNHPAVRRFGDAVLAMLDNYRESIQHTRHVDGLGMGDQHAEREVRAIERRVRAMLSVSQSITREALGDE